MDMLEDGRENAKEMIDRGIFEEEWPSIPKELGNRSPTPPKFTDNRRKKEGASIGIYMKYFVYNSEMEGYTNQVWIYYVRRNGGFK